MRIGCRSDNYPDQNSRINNQTEKKHHRPYKTSHAADLRISSLIFITILLQIITPHCHFVVNIRYNGVMRVGLRNALHTIEIRLILAIISILIVSHDCPHQF